MNMQFDPNNAVIQLCIKGMALEESGNVKEALITFSSAWDQSTNAYERFLAAYHLGLRQKKSQEQLNWLERALAFAQQIKGQNVESAFPTLYLKIAECYEALNETKKARENLKLSQSFKGSPTDTGPFYHGTKADLKVGDILTSGQDSNYQADVQLNHIYFTANLTVAKLGAALAKGDGAERVYIVEPTGVFEDDPNVTDKKFPGNLTRSYRSKLPLKIVGEAVEGAKLTPGQRQEWEEKFEKSKGEIIN